MKHVNNPYIQQFHSAPDDQGGGGEGESPEDMLLEDESTGNETPAPDDDVAPVAPSPGVTLDPAALAKEFGGVLKDTLKEHLPAKETKQMTPEERDKLLQKLNLDDNFFAKFNNVDTQKEAMRELHDGIARYADNLTQVRIGHLEKKLLDLMDERYSPMAQYFQEQQATAQLDRFGKFAPQLSNPALRGMIAAVGQQLVAAGKTYKTEQEMFADIAKGCEAAIQVNHPDFKLNLAARAAKPGNPNALPKTSSGAGGGAGSGTGTGKQSDGTPKSYALAHL